MQSERWQSCTEVFDAAIEQPRNGRAAFLEQRCQGDQALRRGVEVLLRYHDQSGDFIEIPAFEVAPELLVSVPEALLGQHLGAYLVQAILGSGGMGVVYLAADERLGRKVALKLLPRALIANEAKLRLLKCEARTASALNHPNIVTIHEIGEADATHFIATEFIEGITLRERISKGAIPPNEALDIALQIASALRVAHRADIVHRDIKPENVMLRPDGIVKVLDFGIAKLIEQPAPRGEIIGTQRYMSPEQQRGETVDARSDLWSLGVVPSEMLGGAAPAGLKQIVQRCLQEHPAARYPDADALLAALRAAKAKAQRSIVSPLPWIGLSLAAAVLTALALSNLLRSPSQPNDKGVAVLPFANLTSDKSDAFLADGIHDDVLASLGKIKDLKVIARSSVMDYRGVRLAGRVGEIGRALRVAHVVEGSVRRSAEQVVVNVALIDTRDERQVWTQRYERTMTDTLSLQGELAIEIASALQATLTPAEGTLVAAKPTENPEAYLLYLRAREIDLAAWLPQGEEAAIKLYQQAIDLDPTFALARARLSICATQRALWEKPSDWPAKARSEAEEAMRLRPELGEAHLALSHCYLFGEDNYDRALRELERAAELLPSSAEVPLTAAFIYKRQARFRERVAALQRAEALDPRSPKVLGYLTNTLRWVRDWPGAINSIDRYDVVTQGIGCLRSRRERANDEFRLHGDINVLKKAIAEQPDSDAPATRGSLNLMRYETAILERDYAAAARLLAAIPSELFGDSDDPVSPHLKPFHEALLAVATNAAGKDAALKLARGAVEKRLESSVFDKPHQDLALLDAFLGRKQEAIREAQSAFDHAPGPSSGTIEKNNALATLAMVYTQVGEPDKAIDLIEHLLSVPGELQCGAVYNMTLTDLKWRWQWDPLRGHPRFQKIVARPEPTTIF